MIKFNMCKYQTTADILLPQRYVKTCLSFIYVSGFIPLLNCTCTFCASDHKKQTAMLHIYELNIAT